LSKLTDKIKKLADVLLTKKIEHLAACIGFDGFIDEIFRVVRTRENFSESLTFQTIAEFSDFLGASAGKSSDIEIIPQGIKLGGNAPIMANALAELGIRTYCIGALGLGEVHQVFRKLSTNCIPLSIEEPGYTHAFEFNDGKIMFGQWESLHNIHWDTIKEQVGLPKLIRLFSESRIIGIANWSALYQMDSILNGILNEVLPQVDPEILKTKSAFFDIADPSRRKREEILNLLETLKRFSSYFHVVLGLNEKEARIIYQSIDPDNKSEDDIVEISNAIFKSVEIDTLVIHLLSSAVGVNQESTCEIPNFYIENPKISTGGGDNFNAGFCLGLLLGLPLNQTIMTANATAAFYVRNGFSPSFENLIGFLRANE
jgi:sugar/nucleoside kinase (ribokinase family)